MAQQSEKENASAGSERMDKILALSGYGTRKEVKNLLRTGVVCVNGTVVKDAAAHFDTLHDTLTVDGETVPVRRHVYLMMNKCGGAVCANRDGDHETVFDLLDEAYRHPFLGGDLNLVGRLDLDTEGLLIFTTDGTLTHRLISPKNNCGKTYLVYLRDTVSSEQKEVLREKFSAGFHIGPEGHEAEFECLPSRLTWDSDSGFEKAAVYLPEGRPVPAAAALLTICEGKYHQVKRMFSECGNEVVYLKRIAEGALLLDPSLASGVCRELSEDEIRELEYPDTI